MTEHAVHVRLKPIVPLRVCGDTDLNVDGVFIHSFIKVVVSKNIKAWYKNVLLVVSNHAETVCKDVLVNCFYDTQWGKSFLFLYLL